MHSRMLRHGFLIFALLVAACEGGAVAAPGLAREDGFPCTIRLVPAGIVLRGDSSGNFAPGRQVVRTSGGDFLAGSIAGDQVIRWSPDGRRLAAFGRRGEGPGEFGPGALNLFLMPGDSILVRDGRFRYTIFDPSGHPVRGWQETQLNGLAGSTHVLEDGRLLSTYPRSPVGADSATLIFGSDGKPQKAFGELSPGLRSRNDGRRLSTYAGNGRFWITPGDDASRGYVLEQWDTAGQLVDTLKRTVSWFGAADTSLRRRGTTSFPWIRLIHADSVGWLTVAILTYPFGIGFDSAMTANRNRYQQTHMEVIDPFTKQVVASATGAAMDFPEAFFPGSRLGYRLISEGDAGWVLHVVRMDLVARSDSTRTCEVAAVE